MPISNTYNGGTTISGGALFAANGTTYWNGTQRHANGGTAGVGTILASNTASVPNSATGTGPVVVNAGGTFGGSKIGGAVGMPGTGPVTINAGGYLLPGGGYYVDPTGNGTGGWATKRHAGTMAVAVDPAFTPTVGPAFHVLGDLILNSGANVNFNFSSTASDTINVGGALNLAGGTGTVNISLNPIGISGDPDLQRSQCSFSFTLAHAAAGRTSLPPLRRPVGDSFASRRQPASTWLPAGRQILSGAAATNSGSLGHLRRPPTSRRPAWPATFKSSDNVTFDDTAATTVVTVTSSGVSPAAVTFNNNQKTYTIQGGPITGSAARERPGRRHGDLQQQQHL